MYYTISLFLVCWLREAVFEIGITNIPAVSTLIISGISSYQQKELHSTPTSAVLKPVQAGLETSSSRSWNQFKQVLKPVKKGLNLLKQLMFSNDLLLVVGQDLSDGMVDQFVTAEETSEGSLKKRREIRFSK